MPTLVDGPAPAPASFTVLLRPSRESIAAARRQVQRKAMVIAAMGLTGYGILVVAPVPLVVRFAGAFLLCVAAVMTATCIMHDANHGAFTTKRSTNHLVGFSADLLGASSLLWRAKHSNLHHTSTNVAGLDSDIELAPFARLHPAQPWKPWHRYQHLYLWFLYGFVVLQWFVLADTAALWRALVRPTVRQPRPSAFEVAGVVLGKVLHIGWAIVIPLLLHSWWHVALWYLGISWVGGLALSMIFQVAHCVDEAEFPDDDSPTDRQGFERHQISTTVDIRSENPLVAATLRWTLGGLDHQIEHHLAPRLPHTLYPQIAPQLAALCAERGIKYREHTSVHGALASHARWLRRMGARPEATWSPSERAVGARRR